jgi:hypothetical protein
MGPFSVPLTNDAVSGAGAPAPQAAPRGIDYAWHGALDFDCMRAAGVTFIMRYFSNDPTKDLSASELAAANAAGLPVGVVWETTADRMLGGSSAGWDDAHAADGMAMALGMRGIPIYFACDFDATEADQVLINSYLDGASSVIGRDRVGIYGGYWPVSRALDADRARWAWQTYAWSGGQWDARAQLRQVQNDVTVCGVSSDWDEAHAKDYGQWPRPGGDPVTTPAAPITVLPPGNWTTAVLTGPGGDGKQYSAYWDGKAWHTNLWPVPHA